MTMLRRHGNVLRNWRGLTLVETMMATSILTLLSGVLLLLSSSATKLFWNKVIGNTLEGELDATEEQLKKDIWTAADAGTLGAGCPLENPQSPTIVTWLCLDMAPANPGAWDAGDVRYRVVSPSQVGGSGLPDVRLVRYVYDGTSWQPGRTVAHYLDQTNPANTAVAVTVNAGPPLRRTVTFSIMNRRQDSFGQQYQRWLQNHTVRLQAPG